MDSPSETTLARSKETSNYARLCRLLVDGGSKVLRNTFDKIHPPATLHATLSSHPVRARLETLYKERHKILYRTQWEKLYPSCPSSVSSREFDITLLMVLLRNISGLNPPANGWSNPPAATEKSTEADITRLRNYRNKVFAHASNVSVDDLTFGKYWQDIRQTLIRLGGQRYGPYIDKLRVDCMDPDIEEHYRELFKQWAENTDVTEEKEGNSGCLYSRSIDISLLEPPVDFRSTSNYLNAKAGLRSLIRSLQFWRKHKPGVSSRTSARRMNEIPMNEEVDCTKHGINRIPPEMCHTDEEIKVTKEIITLLEEAVNFHQSDHIAEARKKLWHVFQTVSHAKDLKLKIFQFPTKHDLRVLSRGKKLFLEEGVSCSVKHGTLLLDSSYSGAQFYISFLNVIGAFAVVISEIKIAKEIFSLLIGLHEQSDVTSRRRDLGAAYNSRGCISLILGDFKQAESDFEKSLKHLNSEKRHRPQSSLLETMFIAVNCNIARLFLLSRRFPEALEKQEKLVKKCKECKELQELPLQVVFTVLNNQAVLCTTLGNFNKAEEALKWLIFYCYDMNREDCEFLLNFVSLHLSEVLLLHGKSKEAEKAFGIETLQSADGIELVEMFGGLHINVRIEAFEKLVDVIFLKGKIRFACELLETGVNILKKSFGADHFNVASLLHKQGAILSCIGEVSMAAEKFKCSLDILKEMFGVSHPLLLKCYMSLGDQTLKLQRTDDSFLYFQRAMENIEEIYQVSFVSELSRKYMEITVEPFQERTLWDDTRRIEGLVAEHGLAFAVLLSRPVLQDNNSSLRRRKGTQLITTSDSMDIISLKCSRDFLQSGQTLLRQGMKKEAAAFFRQAAKYCTANHMVKGLPNPCLARLYSILTKKQLGSQEALDDNRDLIDCLEELGEVTTNVITDSRSKRSTEAIATVTSDCQLNLKLVLIFLILLSNQMKMIDTTFAAYELYAKLSQNDESLLLFLNGGVQVFASRTSITCNGNTAVQDVLVSSTACLHEDDSESPISANRLFRSLACKKNVSTDRYLVTYSSPVLLDINDVQELERKISTSVQECFQLKCFETGIRGSASQVVVDLTSTSTCHLYDISSIGRRIELLSLCLPDEASAKVSHGGDVSEISATMYQKITRLTFEDELTSSFVFGKNILSLLQYNSGKIQSLSVQSQFLSISIIHPVKARLTLWRMGKCIKQKIQIVQSASHGKTGWTAHQQTPCKELVEDCNAADMFSWPEIEYWAKTYHAKFLTDDIKSDEPQDASNERSERHGIIFDGRNDGRVHISSDETEQKELLRICLNDSVLEGLTFISDISRQLYAAETREGDDVIEVVPDMTGASCSPSFSQSQLQQEIISSDSQQATIDPEVEIARNNLTLEAPISAAVEEQPWTPKGNPMEREEDDNELGRSLFEEKRKSRRFFMAELPKSLKNEKGTSDSNVVNSKSALEEVIQIGGDLLIDLPRAGTRYIAKSAQSKTRSDITSSEQPPFKTEAELQTPNLSEPWLHDEKPREADEEKALERHYFEEDKNARSVSIERLKDPNSEKTTNKSNSLGIENSPVCEKPSGKQETGKDPCYDQTRKFESSPLPCATGQMAQEEEKHTIIKPTAENVFSKVEVEDATLLNLCQEEKPASTHDQSQHQKEVHRPGTHIATYVEMDRPSLQIGAMKDYTVQERYGGEITESTKEQNEPLENKVISKPVSYGHLTTTRTPGSSFELDDDIVPDGPASGTSRRIHSNANDSTSLTSTNGVDRPLERVENNLQSQSGLLPENDYYDHALQNGTQRSARSQFVHKNAKATAFRQPFLVFLGGDVLVDGHSSNASCEEDVVDGPVSTNFPIGGKVGIHGDEAFRTSLYTSKEIIGNETASFPLDIASNVINDPNHSPKIDAYLNDMPLDFGGARPKGRSTNTIRKTSATKTKITELIPAYQCDETETHGIYPRFLERHTVKSNGATLEAPFQDGFDEPYFSAKAMARGGNLQAPGKRFNPPTYASNGSDLGFDAGEAFVARPYTRGDVPLLAVHQKPPLYRKESWHFPPPVADETSAMPSNCYIDQGCVERQHSTHFEGSIISKVKALFSSRESQSAYNEMDSMTNEYHSSIDDNGAIEPPTVSAGQRSATEDSTSSLLGSLQQIMAKTVKLIAVSDTVGKQPQQEPKEIEKVGIQEEARGSRDQEQAVTTVVEDSRNPEDSSQENKQSQDTDGQSIPTQERQSIPVQESPRPVCSHYQRRCLVRFPCCEKFYPCHRCHNESEDCSDDQARAINATHIRCTICYHEQAIDEQSQTCGGCKSKMSEYFCPTCKHFTSVDKNPFHCDKCGICRIHRDRSFHCDVCNVCLDKRLQGKHKCRPDSGHDECCICLEDAFSGCQILPCSHKVHKDCAIAMIQNGVRTCPICRHPLFSQPQNSPQ